MVGTLAAKGFDVFLDIGEDYFYGMKLALGLNAIFYMVCLFGVILYEVTVLVFLLFIITKQNNPYIGFQISNFTVISLNCPLKSKLKHKSQKSSKVYMY